MKILPNNIAVLENDSHISRWVEAHGKLDHDEYSLPIILEHIKEGDYVVDAGAFIGDHTTAYLKAVGPSGYVMAFEPNPEAYRCLLHNCPDAQNVFAGLGEKEDKLRFATGTNMGASHICGIGDKKVDIVTLDSYNLPKLDFLKLDVEGFEIPALKGATKTIFKFKPTMWIEVNRWALERNRESPLSLLTYVTSVLGYEVTAYPESGIEQYDILCKPL